MAIKFCDYFGLEESADGRFLVNTWGDRNTRLVDIGDVEITYITNSRHTGFYSFEIETESGIGLMQLKSESMLSYTNINGDKRCDDGCLQLSDVLVIMAEYDEVSIGHTTFAVFGERFPMARKGDLWYIFSNGKMFENAFGKGMKTAVRCDKGKLFLQLLFFRDNKVFVASEDDNIIFSEDASDFPELCFIKDADIFASIRPSYEEYNRYVWGYNAPGEKLGICYLEKGQPESYVLSEIPFSERGNVRFINENYMVYDFHGTKYLYFRGNYAGKIGTYFNIHTKHSFFVNTSVGFYVGKSHFDIKSFANNMFELHLVEMTDNQITLQAGASTILKFTIDMETGIATKI